MIGEPKLIRVYNDDGSEIWSGVVRLTPGEWRAANGIRVTIEDAKWAPGDFTNQGATVNITAPNGKIIQPDENGVIRLRPL